MRKSFYAAVGVTTPLVALANPVMLDPQSLIAFGIVAFWALVVESGIASLCLVSSGVPPVPFFGTLALANLGVFFFAFLPLLDRVSLWLLEPAVAVVDALTIKLLAAAPFLQGSGFVGISWRRALMISLVGNLASYFVGVIGIQAPWYIKE